jgi:hypothetical protein
LNRPKQANPVCVYLSGPLEKEYTLHRWALVENSGLNNDLKIAKGLLFGPFPDDLENDTT